MADPMPPERLEYWRVCLGGLFPASTYDDMRHELTTEIDRLNVALADARAEAKNWKKKYYLLDKDKR